MKWWPREKWSLENCLIRLWCCRLVSMLLLAFSSQQVLSPSAASGCTHTLPLFSVQFEFFCLSIDTQAMLKAAISILLYCCLYNCSVVKKYKHPWGKQFLLVPRVKSPISDIFLQHNWRISEGLFGFRQTPLWGDGRRGANWIASRVCCQTPSLGNGETCPGPRQRRWCLSGRTKRREAGRWREKDKRLQVEGESRCKEEGDGFVFKAWEGGSALEVASLFGSLLFFAFFFLFFFVSAASKLLRWDGTRSFAVTGVNASKGKWGKDENCINTTLRSSV